VTSVIDAVGSAIVNAMDAVPAHNCGEFVDYHGACWICDERVEYLRTTLGTVGVEITQGRHS
jgi:hypothetical protein